MSYEKELELVFVSRKTFGKYTGTLEWCVKDGVWIDNCFKSTVRDKAGDVKRIIDKVRPIPEKVKPDHIVPPPIEGEPPIENTGKLWYFNPKYMTEEYEFVPELRKPITAWVIKVNDDVFVYNAETGIKIGRNRTASGEFLCIQGDVASMHDPKQTILQFRQKLGVSGEWLYEPTIPKMKEAIEDKNVRFLYAFAHGMGSGFWVGGVTINKFNIEDWLKNREALDFTLLESCNIMKHSTFIQAFTKGGSKGSVVVGLKISGTISIDWKSDFLKAVMDSKTTWKDAFDLANASYPHESGRVGFYGDEDAKFVPPPRKKVTIDSVPPNAEISVRRVWPYI